MGKVLEFKRKPDTIRINSKKEEPQSEGTTPIDDDRDLTKALKGVFTRKELKEIKDDLSGD